MKKTVSELASFLNGSICGDGGVVIERIRPIDEAGPGDLTFVANPKYRKRMASTGAGAILVAPGTVCPGKNLLIVADPYIALGKLLALFYPEEEETGGISPQATVEAGAVVSPDAVIARTNAYEMTPAIIAELNTLIPTANLVPPQGWMPRAVREQQAVQQQGQAPRPAAAPATPPATAPAPRPAGPQPDGR